MSGYYEAYPSDRDVPWWFDEPETEDPENVLYEVRPVATVVAVSDEECPF